MYAFIKNYKLINFHLTKNKKREEVMMMKQKSESEKAQIFISFQVYKRENTPQNTRMSIKFIVFSTRFFIHVDSCKNIIENSQAHHHLSELKPCYMLRSRSE